MLLDNGTARYYAAPAPGGAAAPGAFGVDYQQTASRICLREGWGAGMPARSVGDGVRDLIPHCVQAGGAWGSAAWQPQPQPHGAQPRSFGNGPWLHTPHSGHFWQGLYRRLYDYLGQMEPTRASGYQVVVGVQAEDMAGATAQVEALCAQNGLPEAVVLPAPDAVLCRWIVEGVAFAGGQATQAGQAQTVAVVVVGDVSTLVTAYRVVWSGRERGQCLARRSPGTTCLPTGQAWWIEEMLDRVRGAASEWPPDEGGLGLRDAIIEFGARLARVPEDTPARWTGPLRDRMFQPLQFTRGDCARWPSVALLNAGLNEAIVQVCGLLGGSLPDGVIIGGMGAEWPFARQSAGYETRLLWQSRSPREDVAVGAAWRSCLTEFLIVQDADVQNVSQNVVHNVLRDVGLPAGHDAVQKAAQDAVQEPARCDIQEPGRDTIRNSAAQNSAASAALLRFGQASDGTAAPSEHKRGENAEPPLDAATAWLLRTGGVDDKKSASAAPGVTSPAPEIRPPWLAPED